MAVAGSVFVALRLRDQVTEIDFARFNGTIWLAVVGMALVYGLSSLLLALAWWNLLNQFDAHPSLRWAIKAYGISQIAKYVPGNIIHLAGRQALGLAAGLPGWPLAKSAVWELGLIAATGALFGGLALPLLVAGFPIAMGLTLFLMALGGTATLLWHIAGPPVTRALGWYTVFLAISGILFVVLINLVDSSANQLRAILLPVVGTYVLAWLAGLVTPGAPAGIGVREMVLLILLNGLVSQAELLLAVLLGRLVTVGGDMVFLGIALAMHSENQPVV